MWRAKVPHFPLPRGGNHGVGEVLVARTMSARWRFLMLLTRNVPKSAEFYRGGLGLTVTSLTETWAEIQVPGGTKLVLKQTDAEAMASTGYSPLITLDVDDLDDVVPNALQVNQYTYFTTRISPPYCIKDGIKTKIETKQAKPNNNVTTHTRARARTHTHTHAYISTVPRWMDRFATSLVARLRR